MHRHSCARELLMTFRHPAEKHISIFQRRKKSKIEFRDMRTLPHCTRIHVHVHTGLTAALWAFVALLCRRAQVCQWARVTHVFVMPRHAQNVVHQKMPLYCILELNNTHSCPSFNHSPHPSTQAWLHCLLS